MKTAKKEISKNRFKITVTIDPEKMEEYFEAQYQKFAPSVAVAGFRAGRAPRAMTIEQIGHTRLSQAALEQALNEGYRDALTEHKLMPVTEPAISISKHPAFSDGKSQNELIFEIEFDILPKARIGDYKKIKVTKIDSKNLKVTDKEVGKTIEYLRRQSAQLKEITRPVKDGDWVQISFKGSIKHVEKEKLSSTSFPLVLGESKMVPGFEDQIIDMKKGEKKEFDLVFPKDFQQKEFADAKVHFVLDLEDHKEIELPKLDVEFAKKFGHETIPTLKAAIFKNLETEKTQRENQIQRSQISEQIIKMTKVDVPKSLIDQEVQKMKAAIQNDLAARKTTFDQYLESLKITKEKADADLAEQAKRNIILGVGLGEIGLQEKINMADAGASEKVFALIIKLGEK